MAGGGLEHVEVRLLGGFELCVDGEPVPAGAWTYGGAQGPREASRWRVACRASAWFLRAGFSEGAVTANWLGRWASAAG